MNKERNISIPSLTIEELKLIFSATDWYHGTYPHHAAFKDRLETVESIICRLQALIEAHEDACEDDSCRHLSAYE